MKPFDSQGTTGALLLKLQLILNQKIVRVWFITLVTKEKHVSFMFLFAHLIVAQPK